MYITTLRLKEDKETVYSGPVMKILSAECTSATDANKNIEVSILCNNDMLSHKIYKFRVIQQSQIFSADDIKGFDFIAQTEMGYVWAKHVY